MENDLREKIDQFRERLEGCSDLWEEASVELEFGEMLIEALEEGDLVTRSEMEEAVAKAVANEREACATLALDQQGAETVNGQFNEGFDIACARCCDMIRARAEQKEGE